MPGSSLPLTIIVTDAVTGQGIANVLVTFHSRAYNRPVYTDAGGHATVWYDQSEAGSSSAGVDLAQANYSPFSISSITLQSANQGPLTFPLTPTGTRFVISVIDSQTRQPLDGTSVYVDASPAQVTSAGQLSLSLGAGSHTFRLSLDGYSDESRTAVVTGTDNDSMVIAMDPLVSSTLPLTIVLIPAAESAGAEITATSNDIVQSATSTATGSITTDSVFLPGSTVIISISHPDFKVFDQEFPVQGSGSYMCQLQVVADDAVQASADPTQNPTDPIAVLQDTSGIQNAGTIAPTAFKPVDSYEFVYPGGEFGKYFTASQARMYIGNLFVDELYSCQYVLQGNRIPVFPYSSRDFTAVGRGRCLVQGQLSINFISEGYLYTLLKEYKKLKDSDNTDQQLRQEFDQLNKQKGILLSALSEGSGVLTSSQGFMPLPVSPGESGFIGPTDEEIATSLDRINSRLSEIASQAGPSLFTGASSRSQLRDFSPVGKEYNAVYLDIPFDIQFEYEGAGRKITRYIERCYLGANEQILDQSGSVMLDSYSFIARRLR